MRSEQCRIPLFMGAGFLFLVILVEFASILLLNNGVFVYTLDDPYIHMALAENLSNGHYGVNSNEFSAPSSSILWPFIIAIIPSLECFPLLLNIIFSMLTLYIFYRILDRSFTINDKRSRITFISLLLILLVCATNTVGLIFIGMEHSLQLLLVTMIAYGLIIEAEESKVTWWLMLAIIIAPLIRYENLAISCASIAYLFIYKYYKFTIISILFVVLFVGGFSVFLTQLGLGPLPTSILDKSSLAGSAGKLQEIVNNLKYSFENRQGQFLLFLGSGLGFYLCKKNSKRRQLAAVTIFAILMHLIAGRYGWYNRYEIYIWAFSLSMCFYIFGKHIAIPPTEKNKNINLFKMVLAGYLLIFGGLPYILDLFTLPLASNNIYEQQYQMHRFAVDYYNKPVAVNDLGFVSYKNSNYVLDFWGLASLDALKHRKNKSNAEWMNDLAKSKNVALAMIYKSWFIIIPDDWIKVGSLHLGKEKVTPADSEVVFYALNKDSYQETVEKLYDFQKTLPKDVIFIFTKESREQIFYFNHSTPNYPSE